MKAAVVVANEDVQYQEVEEPKVTKGTVKIKVRYSGICGSDIPRVLNHGVHFYPIVLGHEFSGVVEEIEPEKNQVSVMVSMFGRETSVEFELDQVEVVSQ